MIILHTIKGQQFAINGGLIERVEQDNETHVTLATGTSYMVREPMEEVVRLHRLDRAAVRVLATRLGEKRYEPDPNELQEGEVLASDDSVEPTIHSIVPFPGNARRQS